VPELFFSEIAMTSLVNSHSAYRN